MISVSNIVLPPPHSLHKGIGLDFVSSGVFCNPSSLIPAPRRSTPKASPECKPVEKKVHFIMTQIETRDED
jgi:hypothetical protein